MRIYYFIHITGTDSGISGVPRVVRNLARELVSRPKVELIPVSWSESLRAIVHAEQKLLGNLSRNGGPELQESTATLQPISPEEKDWLLIPEVPHLHSHFADYLPVLLGVPIGYARSVGLKVSAIVHDILPLTHGRAENRPFGDLASDRDEIQRLRFVAYAHALALVDLIVPVSQTTGDLLAKWLVSHGHDPQTLAPIAPILLPEEIFHVRRFVPDRKVTASAPIEFLSLGTVSAHKNQLRAMSAFLRLTQRRPELDIRLNVIGAVTPDLAVPVSLIAKRSQGRIVLHGSLGDPHVRALMRRAHATVFVSLAEGYGLPVAESLWCGKPCLCSGEGSIGEIAQRGGCLTVDPGSLADIEAGLETLATDSARYDELLRQIAARPMKTWKAYASEIVEALAIVSSGGRPTRAESAVEFEAYQLPGQDHVNDEVFMITASELSVRAEFGAAGRHPIQRGSAIRYDQQLDGDVRQDVLFFGPYVSLPVGRYEFAFDGEIEGELLLAFMKNSGQTKIAETAVTSFSKPISLDLRQAVERFEIVGRRTRSLRRLILRGVFAEVRDVEASSSDRRSFPVKEARP